MTTNNHPAHGPVSLDRLHQIREILSKASAQSDGGNLGYAMADAVKVIDGAIAEFGVEPQRNPVLAYADSYRDMAKRGVESIPVWSVITDLERNIAPLYTAPTAQVVPTFDEWLAIRGNKPLGWVKDAMRESYDACRAAMLQAGNSPVTPDGWQLVPKEPTEAMNKAGWAAINEHDAINPTYRAMLAAAPQQENV
ncbi:hypothetical protein MRO55_13750 [Escherichia coli]|uniref:hypothetical protein n=1 Tax=Escherichia coli TaxID=562 RepID=UPI0021142D47|nr:hypothetical protein [Escherichia coli]EFP0620270.1 hypothetical protein [Escherichia coli]EIH1035878.1 hypothetical protein [Escherichia coli]MCQ7027755.1 hypothetical protein [Escherichia coli]